MGTHRHNWHAAITHSMGRQPTVLSSHAISGMNTVLASPPRNVMVMICRRKLSGKRRVTTANAGVYSVAAMATPSSTQAAL